MTVNLDVEDVFTKTQNQRTTSRKMENNNLLQTKER